MVKGRALTRQRALVELGVIVAVLIWGANIAVMKGAFGVFEPMAYNFARYALSVGVFIVILPLVDRDWLKLSRRDWLILLAAAACGIGIHQPLWMAGLTLTYAANASIIVNSSPIFVLLFAWLRGTDPPNRWTVSGCIVSFAGLITVVLGSAAIPATVAPNQLLGDLVTVLCAALWAGYILICDPLMRRHSPLRVTAWTITLGLVMITPISWPWLVNQDWGSIPFTGWWAVFYGGALSSVFCYVMWFRGVRALGSVRLMVYQFATAPLSVLAAAIMLSEPLNLAQIGGMIVTIVGILLTRWPTIGLLLRARAVRPASAPTGLADTQPDDQTGGLRLTVDRPEERQR